MAPSAAAIRRLCGTALLLGLAQAAAATVSHAQESTVRADLSASSVRHGEGIRTSAIAITPEVISNWPRALFRLATSYSQLSGGGTSLQGAGGVSLYTPDFGPLLGELEVFGGGSRTGSSSTHQALAIVRAHAGGTNAGAWIGGGLGTASDGIDERPSRQGEVGAWLGRGAVRAALSVGPTVIDDSVRYTDVNFSTSAFSRLFELTALAGTRSGSQPEIFGTPVRSWASATVTARITRHLAIVAGAGRYPVDLTQGFPGGTYASVGVRVGSRFSLPGDFISNAPPPAPRAPQPVIEGPVGPLQLTTLPTGRRLLFLRARDAQAVEITGDFTGWQPVALTSRGDGWWSFEIELPRGRYEMAVRTDGGPWAAPPGLVAIRDEFGGEAGVLHVP